MSLGLIDILESSLRVSLNEEFDLCMHTEEKHLYPILRHLLARQIMNLLHKLTVQECESTLSFFIAGLDMT